MLSERDFQRQVTDLAEILGWDWAHFRPAQTSRGWRTPVSGTIGEGFPDLVLVRRRDRRLIFAELKAERGVASPRQAAVLDLLRCLVGARMHLPSGAALTMPLGYQATIECFLWRPSDIEEIERVLR